MKVSAHMDLEGNLSCHLHQNKLRKCFYLQNMLHNMKVSKKNFLQQMKTMEQLQKKEIAEGFKLP